jgi:ABC-2 type transport system ATP-binding protein
VKLRFVDVAFGYTSGRPWARSTKPVLSDFSWDLPSGRTVLLGPNGAGKSTLLALGAGALSPAAGAIMVGEGISDRAALRRGVGWMPQQIRPIAGLNCAELVAYAGWLKGLSTEHATARAQIVLAQVDLINEAQQPSTQLSGGQLRRLGLAQALVQGAGVLLLDEPTAGLDPKQRARFRDVLHEVSTETSILVSTHQVDDLTDLFDNVIVIDQGEIRFVGTPAEFLALAPAGSAHPAEDAYGTLIAGD